MNINGFRTLGLASPTALIGSITVLALVAGLAGSLSGCEDTLGLGGLLPDKDKYDFSTTCKSQSALETCSACCSDLSFDSALVATGDCGCTYQYSDWEICKAQDGDFDACAACCEASDDNVATSMSNGECRCLGIQKTEPAADRRINRCEKSGDTCRCSRDTNGTCGPLGLPGDDSIVCTCSQ